MAVCTVHIQFSHYQFLPVRYISVGHLTASYETCVATQKHLFKLPLMQQQDTQYFLKTMNAKLGCLTKSL